MSTKTSKRKLIEVAPFLPLEAVSVASRRDKDRKTGTTKNVHKWFAPMPTPVLRALVFAAVVDAPDDHLERQRLFELVERLVPADGGAPDELTLKEAHDVIRSSTRGDLPTIFDPFCGGGTTLIEAQRLGLPAVGSDLNPVPVLIARTLTALVPQVAGRSPLIGDGSQLPITKGDRFDGLLSDVLHYGKRISDDVWSRVGNLYPPGPDGETITAWLWAWTVECPNPACLATMPLVSSFWLSKRRGHQAGLVAETGESSVSFTIGTRAEPPEGTVSRTAALCLVCGTRTKLAQIRDLARAGGLDRQLLCAVGDVGGRIRFLEAKETSPPDPSEAGHLDIPLPDRALGFRVQAYGFRRHADLYTPRQLAMLEAFADAITRVPGWVEEDGGANDYGAAVSSILALALGKLAAGHSVQARWYIGGDSGSPRVIPAFGRHAMPMVWDFVEQNPFGKRANNWKGQVESVCKGIRSLPQQVEPATVHAADARSAGKELPRDVVIITDPPYFDQIGYADLADYFYVWHRRALQGVHPDLYQTLATPKDGELIASQYRHEGKDAAARYFVQGFTDTFRSLKEKASADYPILIVYAHRQEERSTLGSASTGWDAMLEAVLAAGLTVEATLPVRGTHSSRQIGLGTNSLASYIVMVCRPRLETGSPGTIADFRRALRVRLPGTTGALLNTGESMVDIRQAAVGPGMEVFSRFSAVYDGGEQIPVRRALSIINDELGTILDEHLGSVDDETRWACQWYADHGMESGEYDEGRKLAQVYGLGVDGLAEAGLVRQGRGQIRLISRGELPFHWSGDDRMPIWEVTQHVVMRLVDGPNAGEQAAAGLVAQLESKVSGVRELAQYLANIAIERGWSDEAVAYDSLVKSWPRIEQLATAAASTREPQLFTPIEAVDD